MSINNFIPTIWAARYEHALEKALVYGARGVVNRNYEGEINDVGNSVTIGMIGDPTVKPYTKGMTLDDPEQLQGPDTTLIVDQGKYFHFDVDDVDRRQAQPGYFDEAIKRASYKTRDGIDQYLAGLMAAGYDTNNAVGSSGTPKTISSANESYKYLVDLGVELDEANVPREGRWVIVPPWFHGLLLNRTEFVSQGTQQSEDRLMSGMVGNASGFSVWLSNNCPAVSTTYQIVAGVDMAVTYAEQITKVEAYRPEKKFSDAVKGLVVYGAKVVRPECLASLFVTRP